MKIISYFLPCFDNVKKFSTNIFVVNMKIKRDKEFRNDFRKMLWSILVFN